MSVKQVVTEALQSTGVEFELLEIDPALSDTVVFCEKYNFPVETAANTLLVAGKTNPKSYCACIVLGSTKLDVNKCVKNLMNARVSFASADEMQALTGMEVGAVTPFGLPADVPIYVDAKVMDSEWVILGGGKRDLKIKVSPAAIVKLPQTKVIAGLAQPR